MGIYTSSDTFFSTVSSYTGLAYNNKYKIELNVNSSIQSLLSQFSDTNIVPLNDNYLSLMCKQTSFPEYTMSHDYVYSYGGRKVPIYGDRQYSNIWTATFYNDRHHVLREFFIKWLDKIHDQNNEVKSPYNEWTIGARVFQAYWMQENNSYYKTAGYRINGCFPIGVGGISVDEQAPITIEEFTVDFAFIDIDTIPKNMLDQPF